MTAKSYFKSTQKEDEEKEDRQHGGSGGIYNRQHGGSGGIYNRQHGGSGGKFDDNRNFLQKWADSFFQKNGITADDRAKTVSKLLSKSPYVKAKEMLHDVFDKAGDVVGSITSQTGTSAKPIVYSDWSPAAQQFGMNQSTAYAEHMANTAHQREVADLRAAGLNPVLGAGSGASGVSGHVATSGSSAQKSLNGDVIVDAIGATAAVVTAILTKNPGYGYMAGNAVNSVGDLFTKTK